MTNLVIGAVDTELGGALSDLTGLLHVPVLLAGIALLLITTIECGRLATELWRRGVARRHRSLQAGARQVLAQPKAAATVAREAPSRPAAAALLALASDPGSAEHALADYEHAVQRRLDRTRLLVRAGPAVGLMGTLIPLAPGLTALGEGDIATLTTELRTAFAATVIGILVGTVAFALTLTRTRFYSEDLTALERALATVEADSAAPR